jgi:hypothetical protein
MSIRAIRQMVVAGRWSREFCATVFEEQSRLIEIGFQQSGWSRIHCTLALSAPIRPPVVDQDFSFPAPCELAGR